MNAEQILEKLVNINSVFPREKELALYVNNYLKRQGFTTKMSKVQEGRLNVFAERGTKGRSILFYGHLDTVPVYGKWKSDPLRLTKKGDNAYGIGVCDMKGGIAAALASFSIRSDRKIKALFCVDEENISRGAWHAATNSRKWFRDVSLVISGDPAISDRTVGGPSVLNAGRKGRTVISIDIQGLSSHGSNPQRGINAIDEMSGIVKNIKRLKLRTHPKLGKESLFVRSVSGESTSLAVPESAHMELDIQLVPPSTVADCKKRVEDLIREMYRKGKLNPKTKVTVSVKKRDTPYIEPFATDLNDRKVKKVLSIMGERFGKTMINYGDSVADDNVFSNSLGIPVISLAPSGGNEHTANEWISIKSLEDVADLYKAIICEL